jgi:hypothetical protein
MVLPFLFPALLILFVAGREKAKNPAGEMSSACFRSVYRLSSMQKISLTCQENWPRFRIADSSSIKPSVFHPHNKALPVVAMRVNNPDWFARWNQSLKRSPNSNRLC